MTYHGLSALCIYLNTTVYLIIIIIIIIDVWYFMFMYISVENKYFRVLYLDELFYKSLTQVVQYGETCESFTSLCAEVD